MCSGQSVNLSKYSLHLSSFQVPDVYTQLTSLSSVSGAQGDFGWIWKARGSARVQELLADTRSIATTAMSCELGVCLVPRGA